MGKILITTLLRTMTLKVTFNIIITMGQTYLTSWIASTSKGLKPIALLVGVIVLTTPLCRAETLKGAVYANSSGASARGSGMITFAVTEDAIHELYYGKPLRQKFSDQNCWDIGVIWTIQVRNATDIDSAECDGEVDNWAHGPWLLVREFLDRLHQNSPSAFELFSPQWRNSSDYEQYRDRLKSLNLTDYAYVGTPGGCLEVVRTDHMKMTTVQTGGCPITLEDKFVNLSFDVVRNRAANGFEIDSVRIH